MGRSQLKLPAHEREIPVFAGAYVDGGEFGTGCVKIRTGLIPMTEVESAMTGEIIIPNDDAISRGTCYQAWTSC